MIDNSGQPRNIPRRDTSRPGNTTANIRPERTSTEESLRQISTRLEPRDYVLALLLDEHRTLTTSQIASVLFMSPRTCRNRLNVLRRLGWIDWFIPVRRSTRLPAHWVPGLLSSRYTALRRGEKPPTRRNVRELQDRIVASSHLTHHDGANQFFIDLLAHSRAHPDTRLARWWGAARTASALGATTMRPDGHGVWREHDRDVAFYLEHDTGTETHRQLGAKLHAYRQKRTQGGPAWPVLFWLPSTARETNLHQRLDAATVGVTVATAARDTAEAHGGLTGTVWRLLGNGGHRLALAEIPSPPGRPGPYHPGPATPEQDPLYLLEHD